MHIVQALVFFAFGYPRLAFGSLVAVVVFAAVAMLVKRGYGRAAGWVAYLEILTHVTLMVWTWGLAGGYWTYYVPITGGAYLAFGAEEGWDRKLGTVIPFVIAPIMYFAMRGSAGAALAPEHVLSTLAVLNVFGALTGQVAIVVWFATVADRAEQRAELNHRA
jgi:hypothetical protein